MTFPAAAMFSVFAGVLTITTELRAMSEYQKKDQPTPILDIGEWMTILEHIADLGLCICMYMIIFTSKLVLEVIDADETVVYYLAFGILHATFLLKYIVQGLIPDEPRWIQRDRENSKKRVELAHIDNARRKYREHLSDEFSEVNHLLATTG